MPIKFINPVDKKPLSLTNEGLSDGNSIVYPNSGGAVRVTSNKNYTDSFGYQWNLFQETQVDRLSKLELSKNRFFAETNWDKEDLSGKNILEVGSGAGRFTQVMLDHTKALVYSVDYSNAVDANFRNNGPHDRLHLFQASIYELPFEKFQFDKVVCMGVLQHTPDVQKSVNCLVEMVKPGGELVVDFYPINGWWTKIHAKYIFRPYTKKLGHKELYERINKNADRLIRAYRFFSKSGLGAINRFLPVCDIKGTLPAGLSEEKLREMVVLDTFDMFSPEYDQPQRISTVVNWFRDFGLKNVWGGTVHYDNFKAAVVRGIRK